MIPLPLGITLLTVVTVLLLVGALDRVLDRMRLTDRTALILLGFLIAGHFLPDIVLGRTLAVNPSVLVPIGVTIYLLATTSTPERNRGLVTAVAVGGILWLTDRLLPIEPGAYTADLDPVFLGGLLAGVIAYVLGRSRRAAFAGAVLGLVGLDLAAAAQVAAQGIHQRVIVGGGGLFDSIIIASTAAVVLAEVVGEVLERIARGPARLDAAPEDQASQDTNQGDESDA